MQDEKRKENILSAIILLSLFFHYLIGYFCWDKVLVSFGNLYYLTAYFCMDVFGLSVFILAKGLNLKLTGMLGMVLGSYFFYKEFRNPHSWGDSDFSTIFMMGLNVGFVFFFIDKKLKR